MDNVKFAKQDGSQISIPVYEGRTINQMPKLIEAGQTPMSVKDIMEQRVNAWNSDDKDLAEQWGTNYFDSGDGIMYHPDGRIKVVPNSKTLRNVNSNTPLKWYGSQVLQNETFDNSDGIEFTREQIGEFGNQYLRKEQVIKNPIWLALAQDDKKLLNEYVGQVYSRIYDTKLMKVWISEEKPDFEAERFWCLGGLGGYSNVDGDYSGHLDYYSGRLVGVAPNLQERISSTNVH